MFGYGAAFQPDRAVIARVDWFDQFAPSSVSPRSATVAQDSAGIRSAADGTIETVTVEASRLPSWVTIALAAVGIAIAWKLTR